MNTQPSEQPADGWRARLDLHFRRQDGRTRLVHRKHLGPLIVQRVFYPEESACHVYILHPPGGIVSGDDLAMDIRVDAGAHTLLTTPAAGKFYRRHGSNVACLSQTLRVEEGVLEWLPQENIYYPNAHAELKTSVRLYGSAQFLGWEIACFGLPANQLDLEQGSVRHRFELWHDDSPMLLERWLIDRDGLVARWGLAGNTAVGTLLAFPADAHHLEQARTMIAQILEADSDGMLACTLVGKTLCCRGYSARADRLKRRFIDLWTALRFELIGYRAMPPRIWNT